MFRAAAERLIHVNYFPGRDFLLRNLLRFIEDIQSRYGVRLRVKQGDATNFFCIAGLYSDVVRKQVEALPEEGVFLDIGANHGLFSLLAARCLVHGLVVAFEPNPHIYQFLLDNIRLNSAENIIPINAAVGERDDVMGLTFDDRHSGVSRLIPFRDNAPGKHQIMVPVLDLANFSFIENQIGKRSVCAKIDVEGFELKVLRSLLLAPYASQIEKIIVEVDLENLSRFGDKDNDLYELMLNRGFEHRFGMGSAAHYDEVFVRA